jgi:hypothetical protein
MVRACQPALTARASHRRCQERSVSATLDADDALADSYLGQCPGADEANHGGLGYVEAVGSLLAGQQGDSCHTLLVLAARPGLTAATLAPDRA